MGDLLRQQGYSEQDIEYLGQVYENAVLTNTVNSQPMEQFNPEFMTAEPPMDPLGLRALDFNQVSLADIGDFIE